MKKLTVLSAIVMILLFAIFTALTFSALQHIPFFGRASESKTTVETSATSPNQLYENNYFDSTNQNNYMENAVEVLFLNDSGQRLHSERIPVGTAYRLPLISGINAWEDQDEGLIYIAGDTILITDHIILYGIQDDQEVSNPVTKPKDKEIKITFLAGDGNGNPQHTVVNAGENVKIEANFSKSHYILKGFASEDGEWYDIGATAQFYEDIVLTAQYAPNNAFTITINDTIKSNTLYQIDYQNYVDFNTLITQGATGIRVTLDMKVSKTDGNTIPYIALFAAQPENNNNPFSMHHFQTRTYKNDGMFWQVEPGFGSHCYTTEYKFDRSQMCHSLFLSWQSLGAYPGDVGKNTHLAYCVITIEII